MARRSYCRSAWPYAPTLAQCQCQPLQATKADEDSAQIGWLDVWTDESEGIVHRFGCFLVQNVVGLQEGHLSTATERFSQRHPDSYATPKRFRGAVENDFSLLGRAAYDHGLGAQFRSTQSLDRDEEVRYE